MAFVYVKGCFLTQLSPKSFDITHANLVSNANHFHYRFAETEQKTDEQGTNRIVRPQSARSDYRSNNDCHPNQWNFFTP